MELVNITYSGEGVQPLELNPLDQRLVVSNFINSNFGGPNDYMELFIYDESGALLDQDYDAFDYYPYLLNNPKNNTFSALTLDPEKDLKNRGFNRGNLNAQYNFYTKLFNSQFGTFYWIKEISTSRTEIKLASQVLSNSIIRDGFSQYQAYISTKNYYPVFYLNFGNNSLITANNVVYTEDAEGGYLIVKLYQPLPVDFDVKSQLWIVDKVAESVSFDVSITVEAENVDQVNRLRGPNFNIPVNDKNGQTTPYYNYNNLLASPVTSSFQKLLSYYQDKSVAINVDYGSFSNFIHFSSAVERVNNFVYKLQLIEDYTEQQYSQSLIVGGTGNILFANTSSNSAQQAINNIIEKFDTYEYFLYFNSSSWAWPKSTSTQPYKLYSVSSSQASNFLGSVDTVPTANTQSLLWSASYYDSTNKDLLHNSIPQYLLDDSNNEPFITFMDMIGQHFDNIWIYYKDLSNRYNATNNPDTGISLDVVGDALRGLGIQLYTNSNVSDNLYYTLFGINTDGSLLPPTGSELITNYVTSSLETLSAKEIQQELYKRLYHNLPYLLKSKGTERGVKALISSFGIPDDILTVREFGGNPTTAIDGILDLDSSNYKIIIATGSNGIVTGSLTLSSSLLHPEASIQYYQNTRRINSTNIEVGFSPSDIINNNITASQGYFSIDQLIGNPNDQYSSSYTSLVSASNAYFSTYTKPNSVWEYIRLIKFYNNSLFKMIKDYVPARSNLSTGIIAKSHMLERNKYARHEPVVTFNDYSQSIDTAFISGSSGGSITAPTYFTGSVLTASGSVNVIYSDGVEKYNGEFSGSTILVTNGDAFSQSEISNDPSSSLFVTYSLGALYQNVTQSARSEFLLDLDYNSDQLVPVNYNIVTESIINYQINNFSNYTNQNTPYARVQDFNYFSNRSVIQKYSGSKTISSQYNVYTPGDDSYGKTAAIDKIKYQYAYLVDIFSSSFQLPKRANAQIKYVIDNSENVLDLTKLNNNIFTVQNIFKSGETVDVSLLNYNNTNPYVQKLTNNSNFSIYEGGYRYSPILYNISSSDNVTFALVEPQVTSSIVSIPGGRTYSNPSSQYNVSNWSVSYTISYLFGQNSFQWTASCAGGTSPTSENLAIYWKATAIAPGYTDINGVAFLGAGSNLPYMTVIGGAGYYNVPTIQNVQTWTDGVAGTTESTKYITELTDSKPCWYAIDNRTIKISLTQSAYYNNFVQTGSFPGIDTPVFTFDLNQMDMIKLCNTASGFSMESEYRVNQVFPLEDSTGSFWAFTLDRDLNPADTTGGSIPGNICRYIVLKRLPDETNVILNYDVKQPITEDGLLIPQYIDEKVRDNSGNVVKSLKQQNLIESKP